MGIRLSDKHGVNPGLSVCFWCGEADGVVLYGRLPGDQKAPREALVSYDPCSSCKERFKQGVLLLEAQTAPIQEGQQPLTMGTDSSGVRIPVFPTGRYLVVAPAWVERTIKPPEFAQDVLRQGRAVIDKEVFDALMAAHEALAGHA